MKKNPILRTLAFAMILIVLLTGCATRTQAVQETVITEVTSSVKEIQKYGNLVLTIEKKDLDAMGAEYGDVFTVSFQDTEVYAPYCTNYSDVDLGSIVLRNDGETLILAINMGDFATTYSIAEKVSNPDKTYKWIFEEGKTMEDISLLLTLTGKGEYRDEWLIHQLSRTDNREDYSSDAAFANFREIKGGKIGEGALFRSSSPINNEIGRAKYADALVKENGIRTVMNLADSEESILSYMEKEDFASPYYASLFENGDVIALNMGVSFKTRVMKDVTFRIAPLTDVDAKEMIKSVKAYKLLEGARGTKPAQMEQIEETLLRLSQLVHDFKFIDELDINPLLISEKTGEGIAVDGRIKVRMEEAQQALNYSCKDGVCACSL